MISMGMGVKDGQIENKMSEPTLPALYQFSDPRVQNSFCLKSQPLSGILPCTHSKQVHLKSETTVNYLCDGKCWFATILQKHLTTDVLFGTGWTTFRSPNIEHGYLSIILSIYNHISIAWNLSMHRLSVTEYGIQTLNTAATLIENQASLYYYN